MSPEEKKMTNRPGRVSGETVSRNRWLRCRGVVLADGTHSCWPGQQESVFYHLFHLGKPHLEDGDSDCRVPGEADPPGNVEAEPANPLSG